MSLVRSMLSTPQTPTAPPIPVLIGPSEHTAAGTELGLPHREVRPQPKEITVRAAAGDDLRSRFGFGDLVAARVPCPRPEARINCLYQPEPQSVSALFESMVRQLLAREHISAARSLLQALPSGSTEGQSLRRLRVLLSEPRLHRRSAPRPGGSADLNWLTQNAAAYRGQWVAVANGTLLDADSSLEALLRRLRQTSP